MTVLRIEICNERFLPRFGVDRFLVLLAQRLAKSGHQITFSCLRCDEKMLTSISRDINVVEVASGLDMAAMESAIADLESERWQQRNCDVVICGGWPFFEAAARARAFGIGSIFIDAGAVAQDELPDSLLLMQRELRRIRQLALPRIDRILPISNFVRLTQSEPDRGSSVGVRTVLLGADHMSLGTFQSDQQKQNGDLLSQLDARLQAGERFLLCLGRFELQGYKNSSAAYDLLRLVQKHVPAIRLLILDAGQDCHIPPDLQDSVDPLGIPDDHTLQEIMTRCAGGVSMSRWEGFNLPLAEMQWLELPAFAFNIGAHPEIVANPWLLSETVDEMASKIIMLLQGTMPLSLTADFASFRKRRSWEATLSAWEDEVLDSAPAASGLRRTPKAERRVVLVDVSNASLDPANPGVIRVARRLSAVLQQCTGLELVFVAWNSDAGDYIFLTEPRRRFLQSFGGPQDGLGALSRFRPNLAVGRFVASLALGRSSKPVLFIPETMLDGQALARTAWARQHGLKSAAILYDLIPVFHAELCGVNVTAGFPQYLEALVKADAVWTISKFTLSELGRYVTDMGQTLSCVAEAVILPGQFAEQPRNRADIPAKTESEVRILCVSTLEPRKNHLRLLQAFEALRQRRPELSLRLVLVGNRYAGAPEIAEQIQNACKQDPQIEWCGIADDARLTREFERATFSVYPSLIEGFGLPILESLWMGRPCLTHRGGVMQELAEEGGCITVDMTDPQEIMCGLERMATDLALYARLFEEAKNRHIRTWEEYGGEVADRLLAL